MRLLLVTRELPPEAEAIAIWSREMARRLASRCDEFAVLGIGRGAPEPALPGAFDVFALQSRPRGLANTAGCGLAALRARRFEVVLGADWLSGALGLAWRRRSGVQRALAVVHDAELDRHSGGRPRPLGALYRRSRQLLLARFDAVLTPGARARALLDARHGARAFAIGRGCDPDLFRPAPRGALAREHGLLDRRVLASAGALVPERCIDRLLFAVSALGVRYPDLCLVVAGDGPDRRRLERLAERLRIAHKVRFLGAPPARIWPELFNLCDVFVHLTRGGPRSVDTGAGALIEAQATSKPSIVTAETAADEGIDERTAVIVPEDDSTALADALTRLLDDPEAARAMGERARERVLSNATWDLAADRLIQSIERVTQRPHDERGRAGAAARTRLTGARSALVDR